MRNDLLSGSVQYQDFEGTAAADHHDQKFLQKFAEQLGIDVSAKRVIGVRINIGETLGDELGHTYVELLLAPGGSIDNVRDMANAAGELSFETQTIECSLEQILGYFKRFEVVLYSRVLSGISKFRDTTYE